MLCQCGCGAPAPIAKLTNRRYGHIAGRPVRYIQGHGLRGRRAHNRDTALDRFTVEDRGYETPCHVWTGPLSRDGYARIGKERVVRRLYRERVGQIPEGQQLDHLCRVRACINVEHVEPVTNAENARRGVKAKLSHAAVAEIRAATQADRGALAERFGGANPRDLGAIDAAERSVRDPKFVGLIDMLRRTGMSEFQLRYHDDEDPVVWMAVAVWKVNREGRPVSHGRFTAHEACAGLDPYTALVRLADQAVDGGTCAHCGRPGGVTDHWESAMPLANAICWFRRSCEGETYVWDPETEK